MKRSTVLVALLALVLATFTVLASAAEKTTIVLTGGTEDNIRAMLPLFEAKHPDIKVDYQPIAGAYTEKLLVMMAAGSAPDVFLLDNPYMPAFHEEGLALDLARVATMYNIPLAKYPKYVLDIFTREGRVYALPKGFTPIVVYYNKDILANRGVTEPTRGWTWDEYYQKAKKLTYDADGDGAPDYWGTSFTTWNGYFTPQLWSWGADLLDPTGTTALGYLNSPKAVEFVEFMRDWMVSGAAPYPDQMGKIEGGFLTSGKGAMGSSGHWAMYSFRPNFEAGRYLMGVMHLPIGPYNTQPDTIIYSTGWSVWTGSKYPREAVELVKFLAGVEYTRKEAVETLVEIPGHIDTIQELLKEDKYGVEQEFVYAAQFGRGPWGSRVRGLGSLFDETIDAMLGPIYRENKAVPGEMEAAARKLDAWLAENVRSKKK